MNENLSWMLNLWGLSGYPLDNVNAAELALTIYVTVAMRLIMTCRVTK